MKFSLAIAASMAASAMAVPTWGKHWTEKWGQKWGHKQDDVDKHGPFKFTSTYKVEAFPDQVVDANNTYTGGLKGAYGLYKFGINSKENYICYDITLTGVTGDYVSPARTATHIHEAVKGKAGPPRLAFDNPIDVGNNKRRSVGCLLGTKDGFFVNVTNAATGRDQGFGFHVKQIEDNPKGFFADVHTTKAVAGAVRGQLA